MITFPWTVPALPVTQPFGEFFVVVLPAELLLRVAFSSPARVEDASDMDYHITGTQRKQHQTRWAEIGKFIDTVEAVFPTSIVLAANSREDGSIEEDSGVRWSVEPGDPPSLVIPTNKRLASVVDGQHRLWAFDYANVSIRASMPLVCSVFFDLPNPYQAYLFATVNFNQKKVDRSLAYELWGFDTEEEPPESWTPEKVAVFLTRRLNMDERSPLKGRIRVVPNDSEHLATPENPESWRISTATIVDGLLRLFSKNPQADRTLVFQLHRGSRHRSKLPDEDTPARGLFKQTNDIVIYELARSFLSAADECFWQSAMPKSYITRTVGVQALLDVLLRLAGEAIVAKTLQTSFFVGKLAKARNIDFADNFFQASGKGRNRIFNSIAFAIGLKRKEDLPDSDREEYCRIVMGNRTAQM